MAFLLPLSQPAVPVQILVLLSRRFGLGTEVQCEGAATGGFSGAGVFPLMAEGRRFALRRWPAGEIPVARLRGLHRLLGHVRSLEVMQVPVPLSDPNGETSLFHDGHWWQLEPWLPGTAESSLPTTARLAAAMQILARWHTTAASFVPRPEERPWFDRYAAAFSPGIRERQQQIEAWTPDRLRATHDRLIQVPHPELRDLLRRCVTLFSQQAPRVQALLGSLAGTPLPLQPVLRDVWRAHLLYTGDEVTGLIDCNAARTDSVATDLARLLGSLCGDDPQGWATGLDLYQRERPLSLRELAAVRAFDRSGVLLAGMVWADWLLWRGRTFPDLAAVTARLQEIVGRLEQMDAR